MEDLQDFVNDPKKYGANQVAVGAFAFIFGLSMIARMKVYGLERITESLVFSGCAALGAWGITFSVCFIFLYLLPGIEALLTTPAPAKQRTQKADAPSVAIEKIAEEKPLNWRENLERHILPNRMFRVRNTQRLLHPDFEIKWLYWLAETKWEGNLPHVSANYLHTYAGIDRHTGHPNGTDKTPSEWVIEFLESFNLITKEGQVYRWTAVGEETFPTSPTFTN